MVCWKIFRRSLGSTTTFLGAVADIGRLLVEHDHFVFQKASVATIFKCSAFCHVICWIHQTHVAWLFSIETVTEERKNILTVGQQFRKIDAIHSLHIPFARKKKSELQLIYFVTNNSFETTAQKIHNQLDACEILSQSVTVNCKVWRLNCRKSHSISLHLQSAKTKTSCQNFLQLRIAAVQRISYMMLSLRKASVERQPMIFLFGSF